MKRSKTLLMLLLWSISLCAQNVSLGDWLGKVANDKLLTELLLPGSHDAGTGEGFVSEEADTYAVTQDLSLALQFESGIRAFDLRPVMHGDTLMIAHGRYVTNISFYEALAVLGRKLKEHPTEFAIVLMRNENDTQYGERTWADVMEHTMQNAQCTLMPFSPALTVGEMRGKVLVISRNKFNGGDLCGFIPDFPDSPEFEKASIIGKSNATLLVQDYYETVGEKQKIKNSALTNMFALSKEIRKDNPHTWTMNFASGYADTDSTGYSYSSGYRQNAASTSACLRRFLMCDTCSDGSAGIVFMDFTGVDHSCGYYVGGLATTKALINKNLAY